MTRRKRKPLTRADIIADLRAAGIIPPDWEPPVPVTTETRPTYTYTDEQPDTDEPPADVWPDDDNDDDATDDG